MIANILVNSLRSCRPQFANPAIVSINSSISPDNLIQIQQVRNVRRIVPMKEGHWGRDPIIDQTEYEALKESGELADYAFEPVRFIFKHQSLSPLYDPFYDKFCNQIMKDGRKHLAYELMHATCYRLKQIQYKRWKKLEAKRVAAKGDGEGDKSSPSITDLEEQEIELHPIKLLKQAIQNIKPSVMTRKIRRGGAVYQVPYPMTDQQSEYMAVKWLINAVVERPKPRLKNFPEVMAQEILDAAQSIGKCIKRRDDLHKLAEANKAYAHYRWG